VLAISRPALLILCAVFSYFIGGLPFGYWFVRASSGRDIREFGSGNIGATNVQRTAGTKAGLVVLFLDILKGFVAVWVIALLSHNDPAALALSAVFVMLGHCYPVFLRFKGGKAVACFTGAYLYLAPLALLVTIAIFLLVVALSKYVSLGSILGAVVFPIAVWGLDYSSRPVLLASIFSSLLIIYRHKANISRLRKGNERVFSFKGKTA